jgi:hypothetical protein
MISARATALALFHFTKNCERQRTADEEKERFIMALTRKFLKGMGLPDEQIETIIEAHTEVTDALKQDRDTYKADAEKLAGVQKELDDLKANGGEWQTKYEKEHSDFEAYKSAQTAKETKTAKTAAYKALLIESGISEKYADKILKLTDIEAIELDESGKIKDADTHKQTVQTEYSEFVETKTERGASVATPPAKSGSPSTITKEQILAIKDGQVRRKTMAEHPELFGLSEN